MNARLSPKSSFRPMQLADLAQIHRIEVQAYPYPWTERIFRDCLNSDYQCWVLKLRGEIIAYGVMSVAANEAHILNICVAPDWQGLGHGRRLLHRLLDLARWHLATRVFLEVRPSNSSAIALYRSEDFSEIGRRPHYYPSDTVREDALVMAKDLRGSKEMPSISQE